MIVSDVLLFVNAFLLGVATGMGIFLAYSRCPQGGYQPKGPNLNTKCPPRGGSGFPNMGVPTKPEHPP